VVVAVGVVGPPGSAGKVLLSGESHEIKILAVDEDNGSIFKNVIVEYPDGHKRHHQVRDVSHLLAQVSNQLKNRYNLKSFAFSRAPDELAVDKTIITGDNIHDPQLHHDGA